MSHTFLIPLRIPHILSILRSSHSQAERPTNLTSPLLRTSGSGWVTIDFWARFPSRGSSPLSVIGLELPSGARSLPEVVVEKEKREMPAAAEPKLECKSQLDLSPLSQRTQEVDVDLESRTASPERDE